MPSRFRCDAEFTLKEIMAHLNVLNDILEERAGFIRRYKAARHEIKAFLLD
jgi:hypothetical protein